MLSHINPHGSSTSFPLSLQISCWSCLLPCQVYESAVYYEEDFMSDTSSRIQCIVKDLYAWRFSESFLTMTVSLHKVSCLGLLAMHHLMTRRPRGLSSQQQNRSDTQSGVMRDSLAYAVKSSVGNGRRRPMIGIWSTSYRHNIQGFGIAISGSLGMMVQEQLPLGTEDMVYHYVCIMVRLGVHLITSTCSALGTVIFHKPSNTVWLHTYLVLNQSKCNYIFSLVTS